MKITINQLRKIIREEVERNLSEAPKAKQEPLTVTAAYMNPAGGSALIDTNQGWWESTVSGANRLGKNVKPSVAGWTEIPEPQIKDMGGGYFKLFSAEKPVRFETTTSYSPHDIPFFSQK